MKPASSSSGAVSPDDPGHPSMMPVTMPGSAVGTTTLRIVRQRGTPSASEDSRSSFGTSLSISSVLRTTTGIIRIASASAAGKPERWKPQREDPDACR